MCHGNTFNWNDSAWGMLMFSRAPQMSAMTQCLLSCLVRKAAWKGRGCSGPGSCSMQALCASPSSRQMTKSWIHWMLSSSPSVFHLNKTKTTVAESIICTRTPACLCLPLVWSSCLLLAVLVTECISSAKQQQTELMRLGTYPWWGCKHQQ